jgi:hypothetical protein
MNISIAERRKEIQAELSEENTGTILDTFLRWIGLGKFLSTWAGILITFLLSVTLSFIFIALSGELAGFYQAGLKLSSGWKSVILFALFMSTASMIVANAYFHRAVAVLRDQVVDLAEAPETLDEIRSWVELLCRKPLILTLAVLLGGVASATYVATILGNLMGTPFPFSLFLSLTLFSMQSSAFAGLGLAFLVLALRMRGFELRLFESDPASSEIITHLSGLFSSYVYLVAAYGAILTYGVVRIGLVAYYLPLMFLFWAPILAIFTGSQLSLAKIIQRSKWNTLNSIQKKIVALRKGQALPEDEDRESLTWLLDYHERVRSTRNSALDLGSWFNFLNSLLLPLFAFVLGNIDTLLKLLSGRP